ncbi:alpha/beta fold hydrolase [Bythopirellula polymerisocia]|uniref:alpha/beta fold hydrolase n=1 Tax=Bythopirellula polymerisocia TaxID=2528003 RepID=UPI001E51B570|nr:alpha/beta fold hydrolase [Bythopirellula polymerisocia]
MSNQPDTGDSWQQHYPFTRHLCDVAGGRMNYVDEGPEDAGQTLLFVHGNPTWSFHWRRLIEARRERFRCVAPDHIGCGLSDLQTRPLLLADHIRNLVELVRQLDLRRVTLVAQDWGGAIGLGTLLQERSRFERIVLFNTGAFRPWFIPWRIRVCRWPVFGKFALQGGNAFSRAALRMTLFRTSRLDPDVADGYLAPYDSWTRRAAVYQFVKDIPLSASHPTWQTLGEIEDALPSLAHLPQLLIWGMQDWCFTPECLEKFCQAWPAAEVHRLADVGHWVVEDAPKEAEQIVSDFLTRTADLSAGANA